MSYVKRLLVMLAALILGPVPLQAETETRLVVAIGEPGSDSFAFGTELWALSQIALFPKYRIGVEAREVAADEDRLALLGDHDVQAALIYGQVPSAYREDMRTIMALWPRGVVLDEVDPVQFLVRKDVSEDVIYRLTKAMFEHADSLRSAHDSLGIGLPSEAMTGLGLPLHRGAYRYYQEKGFGPNNGFGLIELRKSAPVQAVQAPAQAKAARTETVQLEAVQSETAQAEAIKSTIYTDFDDDGLKESEITQIVAACRHALDIGSLSPVLGDLSHTGCEAYMTALADTETAAEPEPVAVSEKAPEAVSTAANSEIDVQPLEAPAGQGGPAIRWDPAEAEVRLQPNPAVVLGSELKSAKTRIARQPVM